LSYRVQLYKRTKSVDTHHLILEVCCLEEGSKPTTSILIISETYIF